MRGRCRVLALSLAVIASLVAFHAVYATDEAYIFSPHVWPFVVLPGVLAWTDARHDRDRLALLCLGGATIVALVQTGLGLHTLWTLQGAVGRV